VLQVGTRWFPEVRGGLERYYYDLVRHLPAAGFDVLGLVLAEAAPCAAAPGIELSAYARTSAFIGKRVWSLRSIARSSLRSRGISLIACHYPLYGLPISDLMSTTPTVFHFHGPWSAEGRIERNSLAVRLTKRCIEQFLYQRPAAFVVLSRAFGDALARLYLVPEERIFVIPGGVDTARFDIDLDRQAAREALHLDAGRPTVLTVRRLIRRVGVENLIDGFRTVVKHVPDALLLVGGTGPLERDIKDRIAQHGLDKNVRLLGNVSDSDLPLLYRAADVSIVPSIALEGFGLTTVESLACGTPVLVTPVGGLPDVVRDLSPSLVLDSAEPQGLAEGLIGFFNGTLSLPDPDDCSAFARQRFAWPVIAQRVADLYSTVLAQR
jgi:glycogen(starch) synthase